MIVWLDARIILINLICRYYIIIFFSATMMVEGRIKSSSSFPPSSLCELFAASTASSLQVHFFNLMPLHSNDDLLQEAHTSSSASLVVVLMMVCPCYVEILLWLRPVSKQSHHTAAGSQVRSLRRSDLPMTYRKMGTNL